MTKKPFRDIPEYFRAFMKTAQYISSLTSRKDILEETGKVLSSFHGADLVGFFETGRDGRIEGHHWVLPEGVRPEAILTPETEDLIAGVLETGFLSAQQINITEPYATVFLPILWENKTAGVMLVGHRSPDPIPKELLDIYLAVAGIVSNAISGADEEFRNIAARKHAEEALRENEKRYRELVENLNDVIFSIDLEGNLTYISPVIEQLFGYLPEEVTGQHFLKFIHPDDREHTVEHFRHQLSGTYEPDEFRIIIKDGTTRHVRVSPRPLEKDGNVAGFNYVMADVTERKMAEERIESERKQLLSLFNNIDEIIYVCDPYTYEILYVNDAFKRAFKKDPVGGICYEEFQGFDHPCEFCTNEIILKNKGKPYKWEYHNQVTDRDYDITDRIITWPDGREVRFEFAKDITERKRAEEELRESRQIIEAILNSVNVRIFWKDRNSVYLGCNTPFANDAGFEKPEELIGKDDYAMGWKEQAELYRGDDRTVIESGKPKLLFEEPQTTPTGEKIHLLTSKVPLQDAKGEIIGVLGTYLDITERKKAEEEERLTRERFETLVKVSEMGDASETELSRYVMEAACRMTESTLAFIGTMTPDESVMDIVAWSESTMQDCKVAASPIHFPIDKAGIWADAVRTRKPKIVNDYSAPHPGKKGLPEGHVRITRFLSLPILDKGKVVMVAAVANKMQDYDDADLTRLTLLMQGVWGNLQRRRVEEALRRQAEIIDQTHDSIVTTDLEGKVTSWNKGAERLYGYTAREAVSRDVSFIYPEDEQDVLRTSVIAPLKKKGSHEIEVRVKRKSGEYFYVHLSLSLLKDEAGTAIGMIGYSLDITERKRAEEALKQSEQKFHEIFDNANDGIEIVEIQEKSYPVGFIDLNEVACRMLQYTKEELLRLGPLDITTDNFDRPFDDIMRELNEKGHARFETEHRRKDQTVFPVEINAHIVTILGKKVILSIVRDISERRAAEEALKESENRYRTLFEESPISLWEEDFSEVKNWIEAKKQEGVSDFGEYLKEHPEELQRCSTRVKVLNINHATMALFGAESPGEFYNGLSVIFTEESLDTFGEEIVALSGGAMEFEKEVPLLTLQGEKKIVIIKVTVVPGYEQTFSRIFVSVIDITQRKNMEEALREANKKLNMLSTITRHDILNQIMAVRGYLELSKNIVDNPKLQNYMEIENNAVDTIQRQIEFTRYYQDIGVEEPRWEDVGKIVDEVAEQLDLKGSTMENSLKGLEIFADPLIEKVFYNLIENSIRHGESVTAISFSYAETENNLVVSYRDDGVGINEEDKKKLFERGFGKHTGLGLFLSREILSITGITIQETGKPGKGVHFEIMVPKGGYRFSTDMPQ